MMMKLLKKYILFVFVLFCFKSQFQNETNNWYFGANAGNALGKSIYQSLIAPPSYSIPSKDFEIGIYTVKIISNKGTKIMRLFKSE